MTAYITNQVSLVTHLFPEGIEVVATQNCNFKTCINENSSNIQKQSLSRGLWSLSTWDLLICTLTTESRKTFNLGLDEWLVQAKWDCLRQSFADYYYYLAVPAFVASPGHHLLHVEVELLQLPQQVALLVPQKHCCHHCTVGQMTSFFTSLLRFLEVRPPAHTLE